MVSGSTVEVLVLLPIIIIIFLSFNLYIYIYTRARVTNDRLIIYKGSIHVCSYGSTAVESRQL